MDREVNENIQQYIISIKDFFADNLLANETLDHTKTINQDDIRVQIQIKLAQGLEEKIKGLFGFKDDLTLEESINLYHIV